MFSITEDSRNEFKEILTDSLEREVVALLTKKWW